MGSEEQRKRENEGSSIGRDRESEGIRRARRRGIETAPSPEGRWIRRTDGSLEVKRGGREAGIDEQGHREHRSHWDSNEGSDLSL